MRPRELGKVALMARHAGLLYCNLKNPVKLHIAGYDCANLHDACAHVHMNM